MDFFFFYPGLLYEDRNNLASDKILGAAKGGFISIC